MSEIKRMEIGVVQRKRHVAACHDEHSLWVEIAGPKGGDPWQMSPSVARGFAGLLRAAADVAETTDRHSSQRSNDAPSIGANPALIRKESS